MWWQSENTPIPDEGRRGQPSRLPDLVGAGSARLIELAGLPPLVRARQLPAAAALTVLAGA